MTPINSNKELYQALQETTAGRITKVGEKDNPMTLKLKKDYCVTIYADNHEILLGIFRGRERIQNTIIYKRTRMVYRNIGQKY